MPKRILQGVVVSDKNEKTARHQENLAHAAIRALRAKPVFVTPNVFPPELVEGDEINDETGDDFTSAAFIETNKEQHCYVCKVKYSLIHFFFRLIVAAFRKFIDPECQCNIVVPNRESICLKML